MCYMIRSRDRVKEALPTIYKILTDLSKLIVPFMPFVADEMYMNLAGENSVHLADFPQANPKSIDIILEKEMKKEREIVEKTHAKRKEAQIKVRQPLQKLEYDGQKLPESLESLIADEVNVKEVVHAKALQLDTKLSPQLKAEGEAREIIRQIQQARKEAGCELSEKVTVTLLSWPAEFEDEIKKQTLSEELIKGEKLAIKRAG